MYTCSLDSEETEEISSGKVDALVTVDNASSFDVTVPNLVDLRSTTFEGTSEVVAGALFLHSTTVEVSGISKYTGTLGLHSTTTVDESIISGFIGTSFSQATICLKKWKF